MKLINRNLSDKLKQYLKIFPIVVIIGPRQSGKTTFAKLELQNWKYFDLEKPEDYNRIDYDTTYFLKEYGDNTIIDEAQIMPKLFSILRSHVDEKRTKKGRIVLLGSVNPLLLKSISQSLAGRVGFIELSPFSYKEIHSKINITFEKYWLNGGYPEPITWSEQDHYSWVESYLRTFTQRDIFTLLKTHLSYQKQIDLLTILAHCHGKIWNASQVASALGVTYHTINTYVDIMEQFFIIRRLKPYLGNIKKRIVRSPKLYYRDTGLLHYLLKIFNQEDLRRSQYRGFSFEGLVLEELIRHYTRINRVKDFYFFRTSTGQELDIIVETNKGIEAFEIKSTTTINKEILNNFSRNLDELGLSKGTILYLGELDYKLNDRISIKSAKKFFSSNCKKA